jgi:hypothetical protein
VNIYETYPDTVPTELETPQGASEGIEACDLGDTILDEVDGLESGEVLEGIGDGFEVVEGEIERAVKKHEELVIGCFRFQNQEEGKHQPVITRV